MNEKAIKEAREKGALISSYTDRDQLEKVIRWKIIDAQRLRGQQADENTMQSICKKTAEVLQRDYPNYTDAELDLILEAGISGKLGKEVWVSGASILQWLNNYKNDPSRLRVEDASNETQKKAPKLTKEEIEKENQIAFANGYERGLNCYKRNGTIYHKEGFAIPQWPSQIYQEFKNRGVINKPTQEQIDYANEKTKEYEVTRLTIMSTFVNKEIIHEDIFRSFLLECHYKELTGEVKTTVKVDMDYLYNNI